MSESQQPNPETTAASTDTNQAPSVEATTTTTEEAADTIVFVCNISPNATEKTVTDFFSFCGEIKSLTLRPTHSAQDGTQEAIVSFESSAAAKTAQLLTNALIVDRAITVRIYSPEKDALPSDAAATLGKADLSQRSFDVPDSQRSKTSVIASMIASGYVLGEDVRRAAMDYDDKHKISAQLKERAVAIDAQLGLSDKMSQATTFVGDKLQQVNQQLGISQAMHVAAEKVNETAVAAKTEAERLAARAAESPFVNGVFTTFRNVGSTIGSTYESIRQESLEAIDAKHAERGDSSKPQQEPEMTPVATEQHAEEDASAVVDPPPIYPTLDTQQPSEEQKQEQEQEDKK